ncbi:ornithine carbamoyltransferase [Pseudoruegeria sp. SHC-113]|uniref:ornithine carbamoyltransferase n=1 Tax=Pseudoruegeria sp. SHC-113 TaxID=2855439 RepID=UPI0021BB6A6C|nr:hypothetical protein [Pseudoruegeria sp. SHC-113]MCT8159101.1 hypothetical protein [Pseudoruegeria sp. SHC-113]
MSHHLLRITDLKPRQIDYVLQRAITLGRDFAAGGMAPVLAGRRVALINGDRGWRNPVAMELGLAAMGAHCVQVPVGLAGAESPRDLARYLANWFDLVAIRTPSLGALDVFADACALPVLNLRTKQNHPFEVLGDLSYVRALRGGIEGLRVAVVGPDANILASWAEAAVALPIEVVQIAPPARWLAPSRYPTDRLQVSDDMGELARADAIVTDCWPRGAEEAEMAPFRIEAAHLDATKPGCLFIPCPPVTRGEEVSAAAMDHPRCVAYAAKAQLMHVQTAFAEAVLTERLPS